MNGAGAFALALEDPGGHGLPQSAVEIGRILGVPITNSMVVTWIVAAALIAFAQAATRISPRDPAGLSARDAASRGVSRGNAGPHARLA